MLPRDRLRILDANFNRAGEGLRVLEDAARFALNDAALGSALRRIRHELLDTGAGFQRELVGARDSSADVGASTPEAEGRDLPTLIVANARRVQEALRVLDEVGREGGLDSASMKKARFELYDIEKALLGRLARQDKRERLSGVYVIIDTGALKERSHAEAASAAIAGGARVIQLRDKTSSKRELLPVALELKKLCAEGNALFVVNDHLDLALASGAAGLHLGPDDLPADVARRLLPIDALLGVSAKTVEKARAAEAAGADYIAVGAMYPTSSKESMVVGPERLSQRRPAVSVPLVGIGGITAENATDVIGAGASAVAVIRAVLGATDIAAATRAIGERMENEQA